MTLRTIMYVAPIKELLRSLFSTKEYLFFDVCVFNAGVAVSIICTKNYRQVNYGNWNGYDQLHENDELIKHMLKELLKQRFEEDPSKFSVPQARAVKKLILSR